MIDLENKERILLLQIVNKEIIEGVLEKDPAYKWDGTNYNKPRRRYGASKMTTLYKLKAKLTKVR